MMASTGNNRAMEKPTSQDQQPPLKCPRCDSSNTKFCYYNNYSLSQPRHFCKACKRYWTRGGTLRNVPVGGGCRKNKRVRRSASPIDSPSTSASTTATSNPSVQLQPQMDISSTSNHINVPLCYGIPTSHSELSFPLSRFNSRVSNVDTISSGYDLQLQMNGLGLGFSSGLVASDVHSEDYRNGFNPTKQIQDVLITSNSVLSSFPLFGSSVSAPSSTISSLIISNHQQQKIFPGGNFQGLLPCEDQLQMIGNAEGGRVMKELKMEDGQHRLNYWNIPNQNQMEQISSSDPALLWNASSVSANWLDPTNAGSSVPFPLEN